MNEKINDNTKTKKRYSLGEEIFNSVAHGVGALLAIAAIPLLVVRAVKYVPEGMTSYYIVGFLIFAVSLLVLYISSTLYHALLGKAKKVFSVFDHCSIYILIAGTYSAYCLTVLNGKLGWIIFGVIWSLAVIGIVLYSIFGKKVQVISFITYIAMGWLIIFAIEPLKELLPAMSLQFLIYGGVTYTVGAIFFLLRKVKWMHSIWHIFVVIASVFHFFSIYYMV